MFDGKKYYLYDEVAHEPFMRTVVSQLHEAGLLVRVTKAPLGYYVWSRDEMGIHATQNASVYSHSVWHSNRHLEV